MTDPTHTDGQTVQDNSSSSGEAPLCEVQFPVLGMTCAACTRRVEKALGKVPGVGEVSVNLATNRATVSFDPSRTPPGALTAAVEKAGYTPLSEQADFYVESMVDRSSEDRIVSALRTLPPVLSVLTFPARNRIKVSWLPGDLTTGGILDLLSRTGYPAVPIEGEGGRGGDSGEPIRKLKRALFLSALLSAPVLLVAMVLPLRGVLLRLLPGPEPFTLHFLEFVLSAAVFFGPGGRFLRPGLAAYRHMAPDMNSLVVTGTGAAFLYSSLVTFFPRLFPAADRHVYFDSEAVVITVILLGRTLEALAKGRTGRSVEALLAMAPEQVIRIEGETERPVPARDVRPGDRVRVRPGDRIPVDGTILAGEAHVDLSMMTGEPLPVLRKAGDAVVCGTVDTDGLLTVAATAVGSDTRLARIVRAVERAQGARLPVQRLADRVVAVFTPAVLTVAALSFLYWLLLGASPSPLSTALLSAVSVLVVACPCAMGLATPAAVMVGTGRAAALGILFRKGESLETLAEVDTVLFDKTGTLTLGHPRVVRTFPEAREALDPLLALAASLESASPDPLGRALVNLAKERDLPLTSPDSARALSGRGMAGSVGNHKILVGSRALLEEAGVDPGDFFRESASWESDALTPVLVACDGAAVALFGISDPVRSEAPGVVSALGRRGIRVAVVTGDGEGVARAVGEALGIAEIYARVSPEEKGGLVGELVRQGRRVAFVGDGINDGPALATATVGVALGSGTDVASETADVTLAGEGLENVLMALEISRATMGTIRMNLLWAFLYNILLIPVAAGVFRPIFGFGLDPMLAGTAMGLSSVFVVANSLRLGRFGKNRAKEEATRGTRDHSKETQ